MEGRRALAFARLEALLNDFVVHKGYAYGFDGSILSSIDLVDGARKWKDGRYGACRMLLLADQDVLLITSEEGELALVNATPDNAPAHEQECPR